MMTMIASSGLVYEYIRHNEAGHIEEKYQALKGIDLDITKGQFIAIVGHNGSGKSTLAKHMNAILHPTEGTMWIKGMDTKDSHFLWDIRQTAGMVFQNPDNQIIATIVEEDVAFGPENLGIAPQEIRLRVNNALAAVEMQEYMQHSPHLLSGGQKQRIAIAGVLAMKPECIVLDEPTAMLDPSGRKEVIETIYKLNKEENITIILITHYMEEAVQADRVIVMEQGHIVLDGTPREVFGQVQRIKELGLDVPQATELAYQLQQEGVDLPSDLLSIKEVVKEISLKMMPFQETHIQTIQSAPELECSVNKATEHSIKICDLTHIYSANTPFEKAALQSIHLEIKKGEFLGLIGHTGSGKSTLIQHLNGLLLPTRGEIFINGENIHKDKSKLRQIRQKVGLVFQYPEHQLFEMTVFKDVAFGPENMGLSKEEVKRRVQEALYIVGLNEDLYEKSPFELSGGQKRRVAIAGVLAMQPEVLILDEPTAGLDPRGRDEILGNIRKLHEALGITVILVSHSMEDMAKLVDRVLVMDQGQIALTGTPRQVFHHVDRLEAMGLAIPQISYIMHALSELGISVPTDLFTIKEAVKVLKPLLK